jgi:hypothetical protein
MRFRWFRKRKLETKNITLGDRDDNGFARVYADGEKTNIRMLVFSKEEVKRLQEIAEEVYKKNE